MLLWFIAALSLLVAGVMGLSRAEVSSAKLYLMQAEAGAIGDGAARLAAKALVRKDLSQKSDLHGELLFAQHPVAIRLVPVTGLVDTLIAEPELLTQVFAAVTDLTDSEARALADSVVQWRSPTQEQEEQRKVGPTVYVLEDIMAVPGLTRDIFEQLKWFVCAGCNSGQFDIQNAPSRLRNALSGTQWASESKPPDSDDLWLRLTGATRVDARIKLKSGAIMQRSVWVSSGGQLGRRYRPFRVKQLQFESYGIVQ
jgi:hypothetical protein